jgi:hypothetical protein
MAGNGRRRPPRPSLEVVAPGAGPQETAAITAALEQFLRDTAPSPSATPATNDWERAALLEAVGREQPSEWGEGIAWGR